MLQLTQYIIKQAGNFNYNQQEESISILLALEHKSDVNTAEHDKINNNIVNFSGTIENMRKDLSVVEVVVIRNMKDLAKFKIVK